MMIIRTTKCNTKMNSNSFFFFSMTCSNINTIVTIIIYQRGTDNQRCVRNNMYVLKNTNTEKSRGVLRREGKRRKKKMARHAEGLTESRA